MWETSSKTASFMSFNVPTPKKSPKNPRAKNIKKTNRSRLLRPVHGRWMGHGPPGSYADEPTLHGEGLGQTTGEKKVDF